MHATPYAVLEPDPPYPRPEVGQTITFVYEETKDGEPVEVTIRVEQILFDSEGQAKVLSRIVDSGCRATVLFRHSVKKTGRYNGRIVISDECHP